MHTGIPRKTKNLDAYNTGKKETRNFGAPKLAEDPENKIPQSALQKGADKQLDDVLINRKGPK